MSGAGRSAPDAELVGLAAAAVTAGRVILAVAEAGFDVARKSDASPVTVADERAEAILLAELAARFPGVAVVAEEAAAAGRVPGDLGARFFLVDPLDGTREFVSGNGEYTVNVGLIEEGRPVVGVVHAPALGEIFVGRVGHGAWVGTVAADGAIAWRAIAVRAAPATAVVLASRSHGDAATAALIAALGPVETRAAGSSLKFCRIAEGAADLYPRFGRTMEWDTAAGEAVLRAAGGAVVDPVGRALGYGKRAAGFANSAFLAFGDAGVGARAVAAAATGA